MSLLRYQGLITKYVRIRDLVFCEPSVDRLYEENLPVNSDELFFAMEYLPGQYDQREDFAQQCIQLVTLKEKPIVKAAKVVLLEGEISSEDFERIKSYCINPIESREASAESRKLACLLRGCA